jgi:hypothetical protein
LTDKLPLLFWRQFVRINHQPLAIAHDYITLNKIWNLVAAVILVPRQRVFEVCFCAVSLSYFLAVTFSGRAFAT